MDKVTNSEHRCAVCGLLILPKTPFVRGTTMEAGPRGGETVKGQWGDAHDECFARLVGGKSGVLPVLRRIAKSGRNIARATTHA